MARPKEFERKEVLTQAMKIFWLKGYEGTSLPDLIEAMAISRSSLYDTFGDKRQLFCETIEYYGTMVRQRHSEILVSAPSLRQGIACFLQEIIDIAVHEDYPGGCFFTNTATALVTADQEIREIIRGSAEKMEDELAAFIAQWQEHGELAAGRDARSLARFFVALATGMNVDARRRCNRGVLEDMAKEALTVLN